MRISMNHDDPCYFPFVATNAKAFLDGVLITTCVMADEELGEVECLVQNDDGIGLKANPNYDKNMPYSEDNRPCIHEIKKGKVEIVFDDEKYTREYYQDLIDGIKSGKYRIGD